MLLELQVKKNLPEDRGGNRSLQQISHPLIQEVNFHHNDQSAKSAYIPFFCPIFPEQEDFKPGCLQVSHTSFVFFLKKKLFWKPNLRLMFEEIIFLMTW